MAGSMQCKDHLWLLSSQTSVQGWDPSQSHAQATLASEAGFCMPSLSPSQDYGSPSQFWEQELESLHFVIEMKNERIHHLDKKLLNLEAVVGPLAAWHSCWDGPEGPPPAVRTLLSKCTSSGSECPNWSPGSSTCRPGVQPTWRGLH